MDWETLLAEKGRFIGGELVSQEGGVVYRGPIADITREGDVVTITGPWCARADPSASPPSWVRCPNYPLVVNATACEPADAGGGRVAFSVPMLARVTLVPNDGGGRLDPASIAGLGPQGPADAQG